MKKPLSLLAGVVAVLAVAIPAQGQSSDGKVAPTKVTRSTKPPEGTKYPWKFTTTGEVVIPKGTCPAGTTDTTYCTPTIPKSQGCKGKVRVKFYKGDKVYSSETVSLSKNCKYKAKNKLTDKSLAGKSVRVKARFLGNDVMTAKSSPSRKVALAKHSKGL